MRLAGPAAGLGAQVAAERVDAFAILLEQTGCRFDADDHEPVHAAGFIDAEIGDLGGALVADGRAELTPTGDLVLVSGACI